MKIPYLSGLKVSGKVELKNLVEQPSATKFLSLDINNNVTWSYVGSGGGSGNVDLSNYFTKSQSDSKYQPIGNYLTSVQWSDVINKPNLLTQESDTLDSVLGRGNSSAKDINVSGKATFNGQLIVPSLSSNELNSIWLGDASSTGNVGSEVTFLNDLSDVTISNPSINQALVWTGSEWSNQSVVTSLYNYYTKSESDSKYAPVGNYLTSVEWNTIINRPTNLSQFTNNVGFLTVESDTLDSVLNRGNTSNKNINVSGYANFNGELAIPSNASINTNTIWLSDANSSGNVGTEITFLNDLSDVTIQNPSINQAIIWNGSQWVNQSVVTSLFNYYTKSEQDSRYAFINGSNAEANSYWNINTRTSKYLVGNNGASEFSFKWDGKLHLRIDATDFDVFPLDISGNAGNSNRWAGQVYNSVDNISFTDVMVYNGNTGGWGYSQLANFKAHLGNYGNWITAQEGYNFFQPLENQRLSSNNDVTFNKVKAVNELSIPANASTNTNTIWLADASSTGNTGSEISFLNDLADVTINGVSQGQALIYNGSEWSNQSVITSLFNYYSKQESDSRFKTINWLPTWNEVQNKPTNVSYLNNDAGYLVQANLSAYAKLIGDTFSGEVAAPAFRSTTPAGFSFSDNIYGGGGDTARIYLARVGDAATGEDQELRIEINNDAPLDRISFRALGVQGQFEYNSVYVGDKVIWNAGNFNPNDKSNVGHTHSYSELTNKPTNLSQFSNDLGNYGNWITASQGYGLFQPLENQRLSSVNDVTFNKVKATNELIIPANASSNLNSIWLADANSTGNTGGGNGAGVSFLNDLSDVTILNPVVSDALIFDGNVWKNSPVITSLYNYYNKQEQDSRFAFTDGSNAIANSYWNIRTKRSDGAGVLWSNSHPNDYYLFNDWDGTYWQLKSNHTAPVSVGHSDTATNVNWSGVIGKPTALSQFNNDLGLGSFAYRNSITGNEVITQVSDSSKDVGVSQMLRWKNYGGGHVIFDASQGTAPDGSLVDRKDSQNSWYAAQNPTLMGWNGVNTYGVRVDSARRSDIADTASSVNINNVVGRPTFLSQFVNDLGNYGSFLTAESDTLQSVTNRSNVATNKLFIDAHLQWGTSPSISLAIGDNDTGFNWSNDGQISFWSNSVAKYNLNDVWHSGNFNPANYSTINYLQSNYQPLENQRLSIQNDVYFNGVGAAGLIYAPIFQGTKFNFTGVSNESYIKGNGEFIDIKPSSAVRILSLFTGEPTITLNGRNGGISADIVNTQYFKSTVELIIPSVSSASANSIWLGAANSTGNSGGAGVSFLNDLADVTIANPAVNEALIFDGSQWKNSQVVTSLYNYYNRQESDSRYKSINWTPTWGEVQNRPINLSQFSNDLGLGGAAYYNADVGAVPNTIAQRLGDGSLVASYLRINIQEGDDIWHLWGDNASGSSYGDSRRYGVQKVRDWLGINTGGYLNNNVASSNYWNTTTVDNFDIPTGFALLRAGGGTVPNQPIAGDWGQGIQFSTDNNAGYANQLIAGGSGAWHVRSKSGGAFGGWDRLITASQLGSAAYQNWSEAPDANTIVRRNSNGHILATYFNQTSGIEDFTPTALFGQMGTDGYLRKVSRQGILNFLALGLNNMAYQSYSSVNNTSFTDVMVYNGNTGGWGYSQLSRFITGLGLGASAFEATSLQSAYNRGTTIIGASAVEFTNTRSSTGFGEAAIMLRESNNAGGAGIAPRLAFHWSGVVASQISVDSAGAIEIRNNPGNGYENLRARHLYAEGEVRSAVGMFAPYLNSSGAIRAVGTRSITEEGGYMIWNDGQFGGTMFVNQKGGGTGGFRWQESTPLNARTDLMVLDQYGTLTTVNDVFVGNGLYVGNGKTSSTIIMNDVDENTRKIHCNSNRIGFLNTGGGWGSYCDNEGNWLSDFSMYAQNMTGYNTINGGRGNFGADSGVSGSVNATGWFRSYNATGWYNETYGGGIMMQDSTWVRVHNGKSFFVDNTVRALNKIIIDKNNTTSTLSFGMTPNGNDPAFIEHYESLNGGNDGTMRFSVGDDNSNSDSFQFGFSDANGFQSRTKITAAGRVETLEIVATYKMVIPTSPPANPENGCIWIG